MTNEVYPLGCPFCGASSSDIAVTKDFRKVKVICLKCSAEFALANHFRNEKQAVVNAWNIRKAIDITKDELEGEKND